jgi:hypothetical protein
MDKPADEILTLEEAATFAKVSTFTMRLLITTGKVRGTEIGVGSRRRHFRVVKQDLLRFFGIDNTASHGEAGGASSAIPPSRTPTHSRSRERG